jgi:beta-glucosidase
MPLFPFGHGLSYTTFEYSSLRITPAAMGATENATVTCTVKNTGTRAGDEVVQLYIRDVLASVARPVLELKGFSRVSLAPGEAKDVTFTLGPESLRMLGADMTWIVEPGTFRVSIGASSKDLRLRGEIVVK